MRLKPHSFPFLLFSLSNVVREGKRGKEREMETEDTMDELDWYESLPEEGEGECWDLQLLPTEDELNELTDYHHGIEGATYE